MVMHSDYMFPFTHKKQAYQCYINFCGEMLTFCNFEQPQIFYNYKKSTKHCSPMNGAWPQLTGEIGTFNGCKHLH